MCVFMYLSITFYGVKTRYLRVKVDVALDPVVELHRIIVPGGIEMEAEAPPSRPESMKRWLFSNSDLVDAKNASDLLEHKLELIYLSTPDEEDGHGKLYMWANNTDVYMCHHIYIYFNSTVRLDSTIQ